MQQTRAVPGAFSTYVSPTSLYDTTYGRDPTSRRPYEPLAASPSQQAIEKERVTTADRLFELLMTQQADGSFRLSAVLQDWLGQRWPAVKAAAEQHGEALVLTAIVVKLLAQEAADRDFFQQHCPTMLVQQMALDQRGFHDDLWHQVAALGWPGLLIPVELGGSDGALLDSILLIEVMGCACFPSPYIQSAVVAPNRSASCPPWRAASA